MGDAGSDGTAAFAQWSTQEYTDAINFASQLMHDRMLIPTAADLEWVADQYDYTVPGNLVYLCEAWAEANTGIGVYQPVAGSGLFEYEVGLDIISVKRANDGTLMLHFDKAEVFRQYLNQDGMLIRLQGYMYQAELTNGSDVLYLNWPNVLLLAKQYLHLSAIGRDPNDIARHLRQWQAVAAQIASNNDEDYEKPGGMWLDK